MAPLCPHFFFYASLGAFLTRFQDLENRKRQKLPTLSLAFPTEACIFPCYLLLLLAAALRSEAFPKSISKLPHLRSRGWARGTRYAHTPSGVYPAASSLSAQKAASSPPAGPLGSFSTQPAASNTHPDTLGPGLSGLSPASPDRVAPQRAAWGRVQSRWAEGW